MSLFMPLRVTELGCKVTDPYQYTYATRPIFPTKFYGYYKSDSRDQWKITCKHFLGSLDAISIASLVSLHPISIASLGSLNSV